MTPRYHNHTNQTNVSENQQSLNTSYSEQDYYAQQPQQPAQGGYNVQGSYNLSHGYNMNIQDQGSQQQSTEDFELQLLEKVKGIFRNEFTTSLEPVVQTLEGSIEKIQQLDDRLNFFQQDYFRQMQILYERLDKLEGGQQQQAQAQALLQQQHLQTHMIQQQQHQHQHQQQQFAQHQSLINVKVIYDQIKGFEQELVTIRENLQNLNLTRTASQNESSLSQQNQPQPPSNAAKQKPDIETFVQENFEAIYQKLSDLSRKQGKDRYHDKENSTSQDKKLIRKIDKIFVEKLDRSHLNFDSIKSQVCDISNKLNTIEKLVLSPIHQNVFRKLPQGNLSQEKHPIEEAQRLPGFQAASFEILVSGSVCSSSRQ